MRTTNTAKVFIWSLLFSFYIIGCAKEGNLGQAESYNQQSLEFYQRSISEYKNLIKVSKDPAQLNFKLGQLYYSHGDFEAAVDILRKAENLQAKKLLAFAQYRLGNFTDALQIFNKLDLPDAEYLYYHGLTCEKLNLFDQALANYKKIKDKFFSSQALERINIIEKSSHAVLIKDSDPVIARIIESAPSTDKYPQAGALILYCDEKIEVTPENTQVSYLHYVVKILNERGKENFAETAIGYDSTYEKVELEFARTITPEGVITDVGTRHIRDVSKYMNFPLYSNARAFIISFPEIADGAVIEYKLKIYNSELVNKKDIFMSYPVQSSEPIITANFNISLPESRQLHTKILNEQYNDFGANLEPKIEKNSGRVIYNWSFKDIPQIIPENNMAPEVEINPTVIISTFNNWDDFYRWWWNLAQDKIKPDKAIEDKVNELTKKLKSEEDKLKAIYNFCAQDIRYVAVEYGQAGYEPHQAADIFKNKYGDCKDQAILLVTMLRLAGLEAYPVLIGTKEHYNLKEDFPAGLFNHCIAAVKFKDKLIFMDPTAQTCSFGDLPSGDQARKVLLFKNDKYEIQDTPLYPAWHNRIEQKLYIKVNNDETILAKKDNFSFGTYDQAQRYWLLYTPPELIQAALNEKIQDVSIGAKLVNYDIQNLNDLNKPVVLSYSFLGPEYFTQAGFLRIMPQLCAVDVSLVARAKRKYPIDFSILDSKAILLEFIIPDGFGVKYLPGDVAQDSPWLKFNVEYKVIDRKIYFKQETQLKKNSVAQSEYSEFKKLFEALAKKVKQRIILEKIK